ncbi:hypothetical protein V2J09_020126 [Rumex salicifolius]
MTIPDSGRMMENGDSCLPCTLEEEKRIISELTSKAEANLREGNLYFIVSNRWYAGWQRYVGEDVDPCLTDCSSDNGGPNVPKILQRPGPIDNTDILSSVNEVQNNEFELSRPLEEGRDYVLVSEEVWKKLFEWYKGGPPLPRKLISQEVYPLRLKLTDARDKSELVITISKKACVRDLYEKLCTLKGLEKDKVCIWDFFNKTTHTKLPPSDVTLEESDLQMDQDVVYDRSMKILFDVKDKRCANADDSGSTGKELALVSIEPSRSSVTIAGGPSLSNGHSTSYNSNLYPGSKLNLSSSSIDDGYDRLSSKMKGERGGLAGLQNLGNTCFMNSALQCLVHTPLLVEYFLGDYFTEINKKNPLGMQGELAIAFGDLLRSMWSSGRTAIAPRVFKGKVARFAPQFSGYNQHDSQELLAFLLDGLHEDLNRVKQKPYIEIKDSDGRPDQEYADECWRIHKARNDSIIVDTCQGQYKSTLVCPTCNKVSITFDPFMYLSLPLPSMVTRTMTVTLLYGDGSHLPMPYTVMVPKVGICRDLIQALSIACCLGNEENLLLAEVYEHKIFRYLDIPTEPLSSIKDDELIVAYRVPKKRLGLHRIEIVHNCPENFDNPKFRDEKLIGTPLVTYLKVEDLTAATINTTLDTILSPLKKSTYRSLSTTHNDQENDCGSNHASEIMEEETESSPMDTSTFKEETSEFKLSFQLSLIDSRGASSKPIEDGHVLRPGQCARVTLDWTDKKNEFYDISFLEDLPVVFKHGFNAKKTRQETISLFSCLDAFLKEEPLGPDDMYCPGCKEHREASKKLDLWRLPEILVIHLKRFSYSRYLKNKLDTYVNFPVHNLDLSKYVSMKDESSPMSHMYELYAISNHYGGLGGGHYTAYAKLIDDSRWYHFDDSHVSPVKEDDIKTPAAYVLFYRRVKGEAMQTPPSEPN